MLRDCHVCLLWFWPASRVLCFKIFAPFLLLFAYFLFILFACIVVCLCCLLVFFKLFACLLFMLYACFVYVACWLFMLFA